MSSCALKLLPGDSMTLHVRLGSSEHPTLVAVAYVRPADDDRFHWVRQTNGDLVRVHDSQIVERPVARFEPQGAQNVFPGGRW